MRKSPVHYIAPSAISVTPNANDSAQDIAVHVARGAKIKVCYQPIAELGYDDASYKEWSLRGRNRRLADREAPYTIYARLSKTDHTKGYLVFAAQVMDEESGEWRDPYVLSPNTSATSAIRLEGADGGRYLWGAIPERQAEDGRSDHWWVRLGSVSAADASGQRAVELDTGILGTDQYNMDWYLNPDNMPERPVRVIQVDRGEWTDSPVVEYSGADGAMAPDGTLPEDVAEALGWTGTDVISAVHGQPIVEPYHHRGLTRDRWLTHRLADYEAGYTDAELYEKLTTPSRAWEEENWLETSRAWHGGRMWECMEEGTAEEPSEESTAWRLLLEGGEDGEDGYTIEMTKSSDCAVIDPSGNVVGGYRTVSKDSSQNEYYSFRYFTSVAVMKGGDYLHLCGAMDDDEKPGEGNFTVEAVGAGCDLKVEGSTIYITRIWHCNDGDGETPNTSYSETSEEYRMMRAMTEAVAHVTLNIEGTAAVTRDYRLQLVHLPTDTVTVESHNETAAVNWSTKRNAWSNTADIVIPLTASSGGQPVMFQTVNGQDGPDIRLPQMPSWLSGYRLAWADYRDASGAVVYPAARHMAVEITIPIASISRSQDMGTTNLLRFNVVTVVDGVEYENVVPFTLNMTVDKAVYVLSPSVRQVTGTMIGGTWDPQTGTVANARCRYTAGGQECSNVSCRLMAYDENDELTEITSDSDIHDDLTFLLNGQPSSLAAFRAGLDNSEVPASGQRPAHTLYDDLTEIVFAIRLDGVDYESEGVPILRNGAQLSIGDDGNWYIGGVNTEVFAKGTEVTDTRIYYTDPMTDSTPPAYAPTDVQRGQPVAPYLKTTCPASVEGKFIHYVSITVFSDSEETFVYSYGTIGTGNTITVIHDRDFHASATELTQAQLKALAESAWSESTPSDYSSDRRYLYARDTSRYYRNGAEQAATVGGIAYPHVVYTLLSYWGQDGSGVEFAYYRAVDETAASKPTSAVLNQRHAGTAKNPVIPDWVGSDGGWYDDNPGFTEEGQVMYQSVNKYMGGQWSGWGDPVIIDRYARNTVRLDISNEMDMIPTTAALRIDVARTVETVVRLYDGATEVDISGATLTVSGGPSSTVATSSQAASGKGRKLSWAFKAGQTMADAYNISIAYTYKGAPYTAVFTVTASNGEAIWQLQPSMSAIPFQRNADNTLTPSSQAVGLSLVKIDGGSSATYTSVQAGLTVRYSTSSMPSSASAGTGWSSGNITVANTATNLFIALFNASGVLLDRETVPVVKDGENGKSITKKSESYRYATNNTGVRPAATSSDWKTTKPTLQKGWWLYVETTITWSDNSNTVLYTEERNPNDGVAGQDIIVDGSTDIKYYVGDSNTTHPAESSSDWKDISQVTQTQGKWLWSKATTYYRKASSAAGSHDGGKSVNYNVSYISKDGTNGTNGRGVSGTNIYYKAASSKPSTPSGAPSSSGWVDDGNTLITDGNASNHLYESTCTSYTDGTYSWTAPIDDGLISDMAATSEEFALADSATTAPTSGWSASVTPSAGKWIWSRTKLTFKSGNPKYVNTQCVGYCGTNGRAVTSITEYYKATSSSAEMAVPTSDSGWSTNPNVSNWGATDKYLWNYEKVTYSSGTTVERTKPQIVAIWTKDGKGIDSIVNYYKITTSATPPSRPSTDGGSGWDDDPTAPGAGEYLWNYEKVTYTDGSVFRSEVQLIGHVGKNGENGNGIVSITNKFALSAQGTTDSETTAPTIVGSWSTTEPTPTDTYPYVWRREKTVYTDTSKNTTKYFLVAAKGKDGINGEPGHTGRWYYFAGDFDGTASHYQMDETQAPYVKYNGKFWMLDFGGEEPTSFPKKASQTPSASSTEWTEMQSAHKYYIAQAFFGENAYLGSFIINGDWMISQFGVIYDTRGDAHDINSDTASWNGYSKGNAYTLFKASYPNSSRPGYNNFCPYFAVDGKTGKTYQNSAYVKGDIYATGGMIGGLSIYDNGQSFQGNMILKGQLALSNGNTNKASLINNSGAELWGNLVLGISNNGLMSDAYYNQNGKGMAIANSTPVWVAQNDITLPAWCPIGTIVFVIPLLRDITVRLANTNQMRIISGTGDLVTESNIGKTHAFYIKTDPVTINGSTYYCWAEFYSA